MTSFRKRIREKREENGFVLAFCALFLTVLIGIGGIAIDIGNWYLHAQRLQRAADAAALSGTVYLPSNFPKAQDAALSTLDRNNLLSAAPEISQDPNHPSRLTVKVSETVNSYFIQLLGIKSINLSRGAVATYQPYLPIGSPSNVLGMEPDKTNQWQDAHDAGLSDYYWLNIDAGKSDKSMGDRYDTGACTTEDNCNTSYPFPTKNLDYHPEGQVYIVHIPDGVTGTFAVEAYDAVFADVGDKCDRNLPSSPYLNSLWGGAKNIDRYCPGDDSHGSGNFVDTTFMLYTPTTTVGGSAQVSAPTCQPVTFPGYNGPIEPKINPASPTYDKNFADAWSRWKRICTFYVGGDTPRGDYKLFVKSPLTQRGANRFSLRSGFVTNTGDIDHTKSTDVKTYGKGRLVVYVRGNSTVSRLYMTRVISDLAGETIHLVLFDIGDAADGTTTQMAFLPPDDATSGGTKLVNFDGCMYVPPGSGTYQAMGKGCQVSNITSAKYNGKVVAVNITIPNDYSCNDADPKGCWVSLQLKYGGGQTWDTTSWEASINGTPVHLMAGPS